MADTQARKLFIGASQEIDETFIFRSGTEIAASIANRNSRELMWDCRLRHQPQARCNGIIAAAANRANVVDFLLSLGLFQVPCGRSESMVSILFCFECA